MLERDGPNLPPQRPPTPLWRRIAGQVKDPLIVVLLVAATLTAVTGDWADMGVILLVVVVSTPRSGWFRRYAPIAPSRLTALPPGWSGAGAPDAGPGGRGGPRGPAGAGRGDVIPAGAVVVESAGPLVDESALTPLLHRLAGVGRLLAAAAVALCALVLVLGLRRRVVRIAAVLTIVTLGVAVWAASHRPPLRDLLGTQPLAAGDLAIVLAVSVLGYAAVRLDRAVHPGHRPRSVPFGTFGPGAVPPPRDPMETDQGPHKEGKP